MEGLRRGRKCALGLAILAAAACTSTIHYRKPKAVPSMDPDAGPDRAAMEGPAELFTLAAIPADLDPLLAARTERIDHMGAVLDVPVGEAIGWAFRQDPAARVRIRFGESRFDKELHFGGFFDANSEVTYTLYVTVSLDDGPAQSVVASGRSADMTAIDSVRRAVALCVRDLHSKVDNLLRAEAQNVGAGLPAGKVVSKPESPRPR